MKISAGALVFAGTLGAALAASSAAKAEGEIIAVFTKNQTNPYFQSIRVGADKAAAAMGAKTQHYVPTKADSIPEQLSQVEDVIAKKPNAVVFVPVDYRAMVPGVEKMNAANIPIVNVTDRTPSGKIVSFVGNDDYKIGYETGKILLDALNGKGNVIIIEGVKGSLSSADRVRGFNDVVKENKGIKLLTSQPGNYQRLTALQVMENLIQTYPQIDGVLAANDSMAIGVIEAMEGANKKTLVIGLNGTQEAVEAIKKGTLLATGSAEPFIQGCIGTTIAIRALRGMPVMPEKYLKPIVITKDNYQPYEVPLASMQCPTWDETVAK